MKPTDAVVDEWRARDREVALVRADRDAIEASEGPRSLLVDLVREQAPRGDLYSACAVLGRLLAEHGGSPTLAASVIDHARDVLPELDAATARAARAALIEGYVGTREEATRALAAARWEYPGCGVPLADAGIALAAGFPEEDDDALQAWAARVANAVARAGYRRATLAGGERACAALFDALELAGVKVRTTSPPAPLARR